MDGKERAEQLQYSALYVPSASAPSGAGADSADVAPYNSACLASYGESS